MTNRIRLTAIALAVMASGVPVYAAAADQNAQSTREHEMLHRAQEALQDAQRQNADLLKAKADSDSKLKAALDQLGTAEGERRAQQSHSAELQGQLQKASASKLELSAKLDSVNEQLKAMTAKQADAAGQLQRSQTELGQLKLALTQSQNANVSCEAKNLKLYEYGQTILQRYQHKGVWGALMQNEPFTGIKEVDIENFAQDYQDKLDAQKIKP